MNRKLHFLELMPVWPPDPGELLTPEVIRITNCLYTICTTISTQRRYIAEQVNQVRACRHPLILGRRTSENEQPVSTVTGNAMDGVFKTQVFAAKSRGELPRELIIVPRSGAGPDLHLGRVAWELTTAEQVRAHAKRDLGAYSQWELYFVLTY